MSAQDSRILNLPLLPAGADPATLWSVVDWEEGLQGAYKVPYGAATTTFSNTARGATKIVRFLSSLYAGVPAGASALDTLQPDSLTLLTEAWVLNPSPAPLQQQLPPAKYILQPVAAGTAQAVPAYIDAQPATTTTAPAVWVLAPALHTQNTDTGTTGNGFIIQQDSQQQGTGLQRTLLGFGRGLNQLPAVLAYRWQNADGTAAGQLETCSAYDAAAPAANVWQPVGRDYSQELQAINTALATKAEFWGLIKKSSTDPQTINAAITAAVNAVINGAPGALDALNELAAALGNDPNFATTVTNNIATRAPQTALDTANGKITILQGAVKVGTNVGNGSQAPVSLGGFQINVTGLESGSVGGGAITISGGDSGSVGGSVINISGVNSGTVGGSQNTLSGERSGMVGGFQNNNRALCAAVIGGFALTMPVGAEYSAIIGGRSFTAPVIADTVFFPQAYLFKSGGGVSLLSPDGLTRKLLAIDNAGALILGTAAAGVGGGGGDSRKDLASFSGARTNTLVFEGKYSFSNPILGPNCQSFQAQVIKAAVAPATAAGPIRTGTAAQILTAINTDFAALPAAELALVYVRFITTAVNNTEEAHLILTAVPVA